MNRLRSAVEIERVRREGRSYAHPLVVLIAAPALPEHAAGSRAAVVAGRRIGGAGIRNRAKRRRRGGLPQEPRKPGWDRRWGSLGGLGVWIGVGVGVAVISSVLGLALGVFGGFFGKAAAVGTALVVDVTWAFPAILLAIVFAGWLGPGLPAVILALALTGWASFAVIVRGEMLSLRERDFISAARVLGVSRIRISLTHLLISLFPVTVVMSVFFVSTSIVAESGLSFLGLGAQPPMPSLGVILAEGRDYLSRSWWPVVFAGGALTLLVLLMNALADNLRDRFDPRSRSSR